MGADQIGFLVKGPATLDPSKRDEAVARVTRVQALLAEWEELDPPEEPSAATPTALMLRIGQILEELGARDDTDVLNLQCAVGGDDPEGAVDTFMEFWEGGARDSISRLDPDDDTQCLVYAGDMSWGDSPDGRGYRQLEFAVTSGVGKIFGIR